ncbi:hypothetical protein NLJ89_g5551 [Agrocybe chaxingu]|uniref:Uncharacterized protein n=1 Tax=Agrocybe chaxingu TaxID=84603 RepID=A0A9W8K113_9AGAR|nr:hypothetical protein NLJ89_g5551 [Agrocybe chaxingu]
MLSNPYLPHVLYAVALTSVSMNLVSARREIEDERARRQAQISILQSIKEQLQSEKPLSREELDRLKRLARPSEKDIALRAGLVGDDVKWGDIFRGKTPVWDRDEEVSKWDQQELDKLKKELEK